MKKPQILLTNDDGIQSPGLWAAARALSALGFVNVVAPREQFSGAGRSMPTSSDGLIHPQQVQVGGQSWEAYAVGGTPAQAVLHAILEVLPSPAALSEPTPAPQEPAEAPQAVVLAPQGQPRRYAAVRLDDDSMAPLLPDGSVVVLDREQTEPRQVADTICAARTYSPGEVVIRWLRVVEGAYFLASENKRFGALEVDLEELPDPIIGQVCAAFLPGKGLAT